jgi:hypothetical protein
MADQSRRNCIIFAEFDRRKPVRSWCTPVSLDQRHIKIILSLLVVYAGHCSSTCSGDSTKLRVLQDEKEQMPFGLSADQCLVYFAQGYWELRNKS